MAKSVMEKERQYNLKQVRLQLLQQASKAFSFNDHTTVINSIVSFRATLMTSSDARKHFDDAARELASVEEQEQDKLNRYLRNPKQFLEVPDRKREWENKISFGSSRNLMEIAWSVALEYDLIPKE